MLIVSWVTSANDIITGLIMNTRASYITGLLLIWFYHYVDDVF